MESEYDYLFKILLVGDTQVGKSSILLKFVDNIFTEHSISTIGVDFKIKTFTINDKKIKFQIWDTAGQDRFRSIVSSYYRGAHGIIIVYDVNSEDSFSNISQWYQEIKHYANNPVLMLVGNKTDVGKNEVSSEIAQNLANQMKCNWTEISAKKNSSQKLMDTVFIPLAKDMQAQYINRDLKAEKNIYVSKQSIGKQITSNNCCK